MRDELDEVWQIWYTENTIGSLRWLLGSTDSCIMEGNMCYSAEEEIQYRNAIMDKIFQGQKATREEKMWLVTHRAYNWLLGYPYMNIDIVNLGIDTRYTFHVKIEKIQSPKKVYPCFAVPAGKGDIIADFALYDIDGNMTDRKTTKMLACRLNQWHRETEFQYVSSLGLLAVSFEREYFDDKMKVYTRENSNTGNANYAMRRVELSDHKVQYYCKSPIDDAVDSLIFTVEWEEIL